MEGFFCRKSFCSFGPSIHVLSIHLFEGWLKEDLPNRGNLTCNDCIYLVSLRNNFLKSSTNGNFLSLTLISVRLPSQETVKLDQKVINIKGLLDSGSLAGDFISQEIVENFDLNSFVTLDKSHKKSLFRFRQYLYFIIG